MNMIKELDLEDIYIRHPYVYKGKKSLDLNLFRNKILFKQKTEKSKFFRYKTKFIIVDVENSLHYKYLENKEIYFKYYSKYILDTNQEHEHSIFKFDKLYNEFNLDKLLNNRIKLHPFYINRKQLYIVNDGAHRLSIYKKKYGNFINEIFIEKIDDFYL